MRTVIHIPTASVFNNQPSEWFQQRLDAGINYAKDHPEVVAFVVAGRWNDSQATFELTEAEVAKRYILSQLPSATVIKEDIDVETAGGFAFPKPLISAFNPDKVLTINSKVLESRVRYFVQKIFDPGWQVEYLFVDDSLSANPRAQAKEPKALKMAMHLLGSIADGDDQAARETLLYHTPFYYKGIIDARAFFDKYWEGGYEDFVEKRLSINNQ